MEKNEQKIKLLVCFIQAHMGGAMTSLVNFLNALDTDKYDVDVIFYENGESRYGIKESINILGQGKIHESYNLKNILTKALSPRYCAALVLDRYYKHIRHNKKKAVQIMSKQGCRYSRRLDKEYDICVAYEINWSLNYMIQYVHAKKKIAWRHLEYEKAGMDYRIDKKAFDASDAIVFVSDAGLEDYKREHPENKDKSYFIPNLLSSAYVRERGEETVPDDVPFPITEKELKLLTVARIDFGHKGFDRAVEAFSRLNEKGLLKDVKWMIIGEGRDLPALRQMIADNGLGDVIYTIGARENPIPYMKYFDVFFLPSRYEGKPMAVTEGYIMGLVPVVTEYASANEQIKNGYDGLVFGNNDEALYAGLEQLFKAPGIISELKENIKQNDYGNEKDIVYFDKLAERLLRDSISAD